MEIIIGILVIAGVMLVFNPVTKRIRKINRIVNKDRTVCDFINELEGWSISHEESDGLPIVIFPEVNLPKYYLYITFQDRRPTNDEINELLHQLTNENSKVSKAHSLNIPYEQYIKNL